MAGMRDWSLLPSELLELICRKVADVADYVRFGAVCTSWRSAATPRNLRPQSPWLLLPYDPDSRTRRFYSLAGQRVYSFDLSESRGHAIWGTAHGWLLMADRTLSFSMLNPLTRARITLPRVTTLPDSPRAQFLPVGFGGIIVRQEGRGDSLIQLHLLRLLLQCYAFMSAGECIVALTVMSSSQFMFCRVGDEAWTMPDPISSFPIAAVAYHDQRFYVVYENGDVGTCDFSPLAKLTLIPSLRVPVDFHRCYFVALAGELLLATIGHDWSRRDHFSFFKLDASAQLMWSELQGVGDHALFVTVAESMIIAAASNASGCKRNCIYKAASYTTPWSKFSPVHHVQVVDMEDGNREQLPCHPEGYRPGLVRAAWVTLSLC